MKPYTIAGQAFHAKERYSLKVWGQILSILKDKTSDDGGLDATVVNLLQGDVLNELLGLILDRPVTADLYEEDFPVIGEVLTDFFSRRNGLMSASMNRS